MATRRGRQSESDESASDVHNQHVSDRSLSSLNDLNEAHMNVDHSPQNGVNNGRVPPAQPPHHEDVQLAVLQTSLNKNAEFGVIDDDNDDGNGDMDNETSTKTNCQHFKDIFHLAWCV